MILDYYESLRTPASKIARKMGYVSSSVALQSRKRRQYNAWQTHLESCFELWGQLLESYRPNTVAIFGSGPLAELPIQRLVSALDKIYLIDIVHPRQVHKLAQQYPQIELIEEDVTGISEWLVKCKNQNEIAALDFRPPELNLNADLLVSANLLSQLSLEPEWYLKNQWKLKPESSILKRLINKLAGDHIGFLQGFQGEKVLYSDLERVYRDANGSEIERLPSRVPQVTWPVIKEWDWLVSPLGEDMKHQSIHMHLKAFKL